VVVPSVGDDVTFKRRGPGTVGTRLFPTPVLVCEDPLPLDARLIGTAVGVDITRVIFWLTFSIFFARIAYLNVFKLSFKSCAF